MKCLYSLYKSLEKSRHRLFLVVDRPALFQQNVGMEKNLRDDSIFLFAQVKDHNLTNIFSKCCKIIVFVAIFFI